MPVKPDDKLVGVVTVPPAPETMLHEPVPIDGALAASVAEEAQSVWSGPALEEEELGVKVTITSSLTEAQGALEIVQRRVYTVPWMPVKPDEGFAVDVTVPPAPETMLQEPVPTEGLLAAKVVLVAQSVWSGPAFEAEGLGVKVTTMSSVLAAQGAFVMVQRKV